MAKITSSAPNKIAIRIVRGVPALPSTACTRAVSLSRRRRRDSTFQAAVTHNCNNISALRWRRGDQPTTLWGTHRALTRSTASTRTRTVTDAMRVMRTPAHSGFLFLIPAPLFPLPLPPLPPSLPPPSLSSRARRSDGGGAEVVRAEINLHLATMLHDALRLALRPDPRRGLSASSTGYRPS